jgi:DNA-binding CsgD family transcriptional regulator
MSSHPGRNAQRKAIKQDRNAKIHSMAKRGMSKSLIAVELGISRNTVASVLKQPAVV